MLWDTDEVRSVVRRIVAGRLANELMVGALNWSGAAEPGGAMAGEHGVLHVSHGTGHALVGSRFLFLPSNSLTRHGLRR